MTEKIKIELPYPPTINTYWGFKVITGKGRRAFVRSYLKEKGKQYKKDVALIVNSEGLDLGISKNISMKIDVYVPDKRKRDLDNILKGLLDSMEDAGVYVDDSLIDELHVVRKGHIKGGKVVVEITEMP